MRERRGQLALLRPTKALAQLCAPLAVALAHERHEAGCSCTETGGASTPSLGGGGEKLILTFPHLTPPLSTISPGHSSS